MKNTNNKSESKEKKDEIPDAVAELQKSIRYEFRNPRILMDALIHSSYSNEANAKKNNKSKPKTDSNERLEFLGDSVLSLVTSEYIFQTLKDFPEGDLSRVRAAVVCENSLFEFAKTIDLGKYLFLGKGESNSNGRNRKSILADAFEALIGAIYIDGGYAKAKIFLHHYIKPEIKEIVRDGDTRDYKTMIQQIIQQNQGDSFQYKLLSEEGPEHSKIFRVHAILNNNLIGEGTGDTKRSAEQSAAKEALALFGVKFDES